MYCRFVDHVDGSIQQFLNRTSKSNVIEESGPGIKSDDDVDITCRGRLASGHGAEQPRIRSVELPCESPDGRSVMPDDLLSARSPRSLPSRVGSVERPTAGTCNEGTSKPPATEGSRDGRSDNSREAASLLHRPSAYQRQRFSCLRIYLIGKFRWSKALPHPPSCKSRRYFDAAVLCKLCCAHFSRSPAMSMCNVSCTRFSGRTSNAKCVQIR